MPAIDWLYKILFPLLVALLQIVYVLPSGTSKLKLQPWISFSVLFVIVILNWILLAQLAVTSNFAVNPSIVGGVTFSFTVILAVAVIFPDDTVIVVVPTANAVTFPFASTVATCSLLLDHVNVFVAVDGVFVTSKFNFYPVFIVFDEGDKLNAVNSVSSPGSGSGSSGSIVP